jgi:DNA mismatch repair protein MLH1
VECFRSLALELSLFYAYEGGEGDELADNAERNWKWTVEHVLFPVIRKRLRPPASLLGGRCLVLIADLPDLYKVFERC